MRSVTVALSAARQTHFSRFAETRTGRKLCRSMAGVVLLDDKIPCRKAIESRSKRLVRDVSDQGVDGQRLAGPNRS